MNIILKLVKLQFEDYDTRQQPSLERKNYMVETTTRLPDLVLVVLMQWNQGVDNVGLLDLVLTSHFGHNT